eukprot:7855646-Alexandrium_andersonii.AAC.1
MPRSTTHASRAMLSSRCRGAGASQSYRAIVGRPSPISAAPRACVILELRARLDRTSGRFMMVGRPSGGLLIAERIGRPTSSHVRSLT